MFKKLFSQYKFGQIDIPFAAAVAALVILGMVMLSSATVSVGFEKFNDSYYYFKHQLFFGLIPGFLVMLVFMLLDYKLFEKYASQMLIISIVLLILVFIPGIGNEYGSARSWIGIFGFSIQPSEIVKLTFLIYLSAWLDKRGEKGASDLHEGLIPFISVIAVIATLLILEPDTGSMMIILVMSWAVYFVGGARISHILTLGAAGIAMILLLVVMSPYRAARFMTFLHPELDPQGVGYHINQAFLALGSGGFFGKGYGQSVQKFQYLPEVMGDSIYAVIGEELGFLFCVLIIALYVYLLIRGFKIASACKDRFSKFLVTGIMTWLTAQAFMNIGAMVGLLPLTGVPLPFISYGGTAMVVNLAAIGIVLNISRRVSLTVKQRLV